MLKIISQELRISQKAPINKWLDMVDSAKEESNPAKKLHHFFANDFCRMACGEVIMGANAAMEKSYTLRNAAPIPEETVRRYLRYWMSVKALSP